MKWFVVVGIFILSCLPTVCGGESGAPKNIAHVISMSPTQGYVGDMISIVATNVPCNSEIWLGTIPTTSVIASVKTLSTTELQFTFAIPDLHPCTLPVYLDPLTKPTHSIRAGELTILEKRAKIDVMPSDPAKGNPIGGTTPGSNTPSTGSTPNPGPIALRPDMDPSLDLPVDPKSMAPDKPPVPPIPVAPPPPPPPTIYGHDLKDENGTIFYVIDVSGSMSWDMGQYTTSDGKTATGNRLDRAKAALVGSIRSLPQNFKFDIDSFDCSVYCWKFQLMQATDANKQQAIEWVMALQPLGGTGTGPAMFEALQIRECKLYVLLTDGASNCGAGDDSGSYACMEAHREMIKSGNLQLAVINVFGIAATGDFKQFCQNVASDSGGTYTDVR